MQTQGGTAAAAAIASNERYFDTQVKVDWLRDGLFAHSLSDLSPYVQSVNTNRSVNGSVPVEVSGVDNTASAELTVVLGGAHLIGTGMSLIEVFSDFNTASPLASVSNLGSEIKWSVGVQATDGTTTWYPQFVGNIRTIALNREDGTVTISALDRVEKLRAPVHLPNWAVVAAEANVGHIDAQLTNTSGVIDMVLRQCDVSPTPYRIPEFKEVTGVDDSDTARGGVHAFFTGTGSMLNASGWSLVDPNSVNQQFWDEEASGLPMYKPVDGLKHPLAPADAPQMLSVTSKPILGNEPAPITAWVHWALDQFRVQGAGGGYYVSFTLNTNDNAWRSITGNVQVFEFCWMGYQSIYLELDSGRIRPTMLYGDAQTTITGPYLTPPTNAGFVRLNFGWDLSSTGVRFMAAKESDTHTWSSRSSYSATTFDDDINATGLVVWVDRLPFNDFMLMSANYDNPPANHAAMNIKATYPAALDVGETWLSNLPLTEGSDAWTIITDIANSEHGAVFWDENGVFRFWNYSHLRALREAPVKTLTLDELGSLGSTSNLDKVRNTVSLTRKNIKAVGGLAFESSSKDDFYIPARETSTFSFPMGETVIAPSVSVPYGTPTTNWDDAIKNVGISLYAFSYYKDGAWTNDTGIDTGAADPNIRWWLDKNRNIVVWVQNNSNYPIRLADSNGEPMLRLYGAIAKDYGDSHYTAKVQDSIDKYDTRNIDVDGDWVQIWPKYSQWTDSILPILATPTPDSDTITVPGDPRVQLGDAMFVRDPDGFGAKFAIQITGIDRTLDLDGGLTDEYTVELYDTPDTLTWGGVAQNYEHYSNIPFTTWQAMSDYVPS